MLNEIECIDKKDISGVNFVEEGSKVMTLYERFRKNFNSRAVALLKKFRKKHFIRWVKIKICKNLCVKKVVQNKPSELSILRAKKPLTGEDF